MSLLFQIIYLICLNHDLQKEINYKLLKEKQKLLINFTKEEWRKLQTAFKSVAKYCKNRNSLDPKELNPLNSPVFLCPECNEQTLILSDNNDRFNCAYCDHDEAVGDCSIKLVCAESYYPVCYLSEWNFDEGRHDMICDQCNEEIEERIKKED